MSISVGHPRLPQNPLTSIKALKGRDYSSRNTRKGSKEALNRIGVFRVIGHIADDVLRAPQGRMRKVSEEKN